MANSRKVGYVGRGRKI